MMAWWSGNVLSSCRGVSRRRCGAPMRWEMVWVASAEWRFGTDWAPSPPRAGVRARNVSLLPVVALGVWRSLEDLRCGAFLLLVAYGRETLRQTALRVLARAVAA
jgi:hypothetical protein